jgi:L-alanine-DL-glutamate epimerase-like enolase superfamily enzyme
MKITDIKTFLVSTGRPHPRGTGNSNSFVFVKVYTDEGVDWLREAFHSLDEPIEASVRKFARTLVGRDPRRQRSFAAIASDALARCWPSR